MASFLNSGGLSVDPSCLEHLAAPRFDRSNATASFFGTAELWGD